MPEAKTHLPARGPEERLPGLQKRVDAAPARALSISQLTQVVPSLDDRGCADKLGNLMADVVEMGEKTAWAKDWICWRWRELHRGSETAMAEFCERFLIARPTFMGHCWMFESYFPNTAALQRSLRDEPLIGAAALAERQQLFGPDDDAIVLSVSREHHKEVAALEPEQRQALLRQAARQHLTVTAFRLLVHGFKHGPAVAAAHGEQQYLTWCHQQARKACCHDLGRARTFLTTVAEELEANGHGELLLQLAERYLPALAERQAHDGQAVRLAATV